MKDQYGPLDDLIKEMLSFQLYKRGKQPLDGIDPRDRIKRSIWIDEGVDLDILSKHGPEITPSIQTSKLFKIDEIEVKEGLFRRKRIHRSMTDISSVDMIYRMIGSGVGKERSDGLIDICRSEILYPLVLTHPMEKIRESMSNIKLERDIQTEVQDISARNSIRILLQGRKTVQGEEDLLKVFERSVPDRFIVRTDRGSSITNLRTLISVVIASPDSEIGPLIESGQLLDLARDGIRSPRLEGMLSDLSKDANGAAETPTRFRERMGRMMMESEISGEVFEKISSPILLRFKTCSAKEASRLRQDLSPLMDLRSSPLLAELVFQVPTENRPFIIGLMGDTMDRNLVETLERIRDFSTLEIDRESAKDSLSSLGEK